MCVEAILIRGKGYIILTLSTDNSYLAKRHGCLNYLFSVFLAYLYWNQEEEQQVGDLGTFPILFYLWNCDIKETGLIYCFCTMDEILIVILLECTQIQLVSGRLNYDPFSDRQAKIRMHLSPFWIFTIQIPSLTHICIYRILASPKQKWTHFRPDF